MHADGCRYGTFERSLPVWHGVMASFAWSAGGVISTANELARYAKVSVDGGLLSDEMQRRRIDMLLPVEAAPKPGYRYGYNIESWGPFVGHGGDIPGYNSVMYHDPTRGLTIVAYGTANFSPEGRMSATNC